jgi:hypothetical protein
MVIPRQPSLVQIKTDRKQQESVEYFKYLGSIITNDAECKQGIKSRIAKRKAAFNNNDFFISKLGLILRNKLLKCYTRRITEHWTLRKVDKNSRNFGNFVLKKESHLDPSCQKGRSVKMSQ